MIAKFFNNANTKYFVLIKCSSKKISIFALNKIFVASNKKCRYREIAQFFRYILTYSITLLLCIICFHDDIFNIYKSQSLDAKSYFNVEIIPELQFISEVHETKCFV